MKTMKSPKNIMFMLFTNIKKYEESKVLKSSITKPTILQSKLE